MTRSIVVGTVVLSLAGSIAGAAERKAAVQFDVTLEQRSDDNILQLAPRDLERLAAGQTENGRFLVETADDRVTLAKARARVRMRLLPRRETTLTAGAEIARYARNSVKNDETFTVALAQEITASRQNLGTLRLSASHTPDFYLRQLTDDDASVAAGRRVRDAARFSATEFGATYEQQIADGRFGGWVGAELRRRDYVSAFDERDGRDRRLSAGARVRPFASWRGALEVGVERGTMRAEGDLASTEILDDDISYRHRTLSYGVVLPFFRRFPLRVELGREHERRTFLTTNIYDTTRFGRGDRRTRTTVEVSQRIFEHIDLVAAWSHASNDARFPAGFDPGDDVTDFDQTRVSLGLRLRTGWLGR